MGNKTQEEKAAPTAKPAQKTAPTRAGLKTDGTKKSKSVVYVGPNLPGAGITHGQVFRGGLPLALEAAVEKAPTLKTLIVPVAGLPQAKKALADGTSTLAKAFVTAGPTGEGNES